MWKEYWDGWDGSLKIAETNQPPVHYFNHLWKLAEQVVARLSEQAPEWSVLPVERDDEELAGVMEKYLDWTMRSAKTAGPIQECIRNGEIIGTGIWKTPWNPDANRGRGNNELYSCDPLRVYFDLSKTRLDQMTFIIHEYFLETAYIKRRWGVDIAAVQTFSDLETDQGLVVTANRSTAFGTASLPVVYGNPEGTIITGRTRVLECWLRDTVLQSTGISLPVGQRHKAKHPDWFVVYAVEDKLLPEKGAADGKGAGVMRVPYKEPPFVVYRPITKETQFYGVSPMHPLLDPQRDYNEGREQLRNHRMRHAQPRITVDPRYPLDMDELSNRDQPIHIPPGGIAYLHPPPLGREVLDATNMAAADLEDISGIHDVARGQRVPQLTAGVAIQTLQQKAETRINARTPLLGEALIDVGRHFLNNGATQVGLAGMLRLAGKSEPDLTKLSAQELAAATDEVLDFDVTVVVGSSSAQRSELQSMAVMLAQAGIIDGEAVLTLFKVPGMWKILERMERKAEMQAQLEAGQQPQAEPPDPASDEQVSQATDVSQLPPNLQAIIESVREELGDDAAQHALQGLTRERAEAMARRSAGGPA
jgi:hypothetical protein